LFIQTEKFARNPININYWDKQDENDDNQDIFFIHPVQPHFFTSPAK